MHDHVNYLKVTSYDVDTTKYLENLRFRIYRFKIKVFVGSGNSHCAIKCVFFITTLCGEIQILIRPSKDVQNVLWNRLQYERFCIPFNGWIRILLIEC